MENKELTFGQKAVGLNFNHAEGEMNQAVHKAKQLFADVIDLIEDWNPKKEGNTYLTNILRTAAFNACIAAQMAVVKFITWNNE